MSLTIRAGKDDLVRQGISTRINRGEPIWKNRPHGQVLMARMTDGLRLLDIAAHSSSPERELFIYAPAGTWRFQDALHLETQQVRFIDIRTEDGKDQPTVTTGTIPLSSQIINSGGISERQQHKPDVQSTIVLSATIAELEQQLHTLHTLGTGIHERSHRHTQETLREYQLMYHMRMAAPCALFAYFFLAVGLGLSLPLKNRLLAIGIGMLIIIANVAPAMMIVKGSGQYLRLNPAWLVWPPLFLTACAGGLLIWRKR